MELLDALLQPIERVQSGDLDEVLAAFTRERERFALPFDAAVLHGCSTDRLGWAFVGAYSAALETLVPGVSQAAFCVTEEEGNHPRAIRTELGASAGAGASAGVGVLRLNGQKTFVTFGSHARELLVVAREGEREGRPLLAVCRIPADREGVVMEDGPTTPFVPEIPHTRVRLDNVRVDAGERLSGDGYLNYVKPFRTVEDIHVVAGTLGYLYGVALRADATEAASLFVGPILALRELVTQPPLDPGVHVALHGLLRTVTHLGESPPVAAMWAALGDDAEHTRWKRDAVLLQVASGARKARFEKATKTLGLR